DYKSAKSLVNLGKPKSSVLLTKAAGQAHGGGTSFPAGSSKYATLLEWIEGGALEGGAAQSAPAPTPTPPPEKPAAGETKPSPSGGSKPKANGDKQTAKAPTPDPEPSWVEPGVELPTPAIEAGEPAIAYAPRIHAILQAQCNSCHAQ